MRVSRNAKRMGNSLSAELDRLGCDLVESMMVGQDPYMKQVVYFVVAKDRSRTEADGYRVFKGRDWSLHPNPADKERGVTLSTEAYWLSKADALALAKKRQTELIEGFSWYIPGTETLVPGCRR